MPILTVLNNSSEVDHGYVHCDQLARLINYMLLCLLY